MPAPIRRVDELGFPISSTFEEITEKGLPSRPKVPLRQRLRPWRWLILLLLPLALFGEQVVSGVRSAVAQWLVHRAEIDLERNELAGALTNFNRAIEWESDPKEQAIALEQRAWVHERLGHHRQAIDDCNAAAQRIDPEDKNVVMLNQRAYIRALAGIELAEGLADAERAISHTPPGSPELIEFIDTRGYLHHLLGHEDAALADLNKAILLTEQDKQRFMTLMQRGDFNDNFRPDLARVLQEYNENLAVMHHHRGEVNKKLGKDAEAKADAQQAQQLGYNPANGVL